MNKYFTDLVYFVGSIPKPFNSTKKYISTGDLKTDYIFEENIEVVDYISRPSRANLEVNAGDILFAKMANTDKRLLVSEIDSGYIYSTGFFAVKPKEGLITPECLYYLLNSKTFLKQKDLNSTGATQKAITIEGLKKIYLKIPDFKKQNQIGQILRNLEKIIKFKKQQLTNYDQLIKARFIEMFGDSVTNPLGWEEHRLDEYIVFLTSGSRGWSQYFLDTGNEIFITIKNVKNNRINLDNIQYINAPANKEADRTKVKIGDLLISITADLGRTGVVDIDIAKRGAYINQHLSLVRLDQSRINPHYVSYFLETEGGKMQFERKNQEGVKAGLNFDAIKSLIILVPPLDMQESYLTIVKHIDKLKIAIQKSLDETQELYDSLMQEYFG